MIKKIVLITILITSIFAEVDDSRELYKLRCVSCHGISGKTKPLGKNAVLQGMSEENIIKQLKAYKAGTLDIFGIGPAMQGQANTLTDEQIKKLAKYISTLK